jgi:Flp pilus assembly pilin Flp
MSKSESASPWRLASDERGSNLVEYVILVGVVSLVALTGFRAFGGAILEKVGEQADAVSRINGVANH